MQSIGLKELCDVLREYKNSKVVLTFHTIGDRDGVGSAVALSKYFTNATVVTPDFITNNARKMLTYLNYADVVKSRPPEDAELVLVLDANNLFALGKLQPFLSQSKARVIFIDHHAPHNELTMNAAMLNDESYNSTASIVYEVLKELGAGITREIAILLLNGISADSADMQNSSPQTFSQISELLKISKTEFSFFSDYFHSSIPASSKLQVIHDVFGAKVEAVGNYIIIYGRAGEHANVTADNALKLDADAAVFWVFGKTEASISARLRSPLDKKLKIHLGLIMEDVAKMVGGNGGGHAAAAGAYGPKIGAADIAGMEVVRRVKEALERGG